jgi:hypothetical protein
MKSIVMIMLVVGLMAVVGQAASIHYSFNEVASGTWEVYATVNGDNTAGLSAYSIWVNDSTGVSYVENTLGTIGADFTPIGFHNLVSGDIIGRFDAGNYQHFGDHAITGIGMVPVDEPGVLPGTIPGVQLSVPALLGTLTTPAGLGEGDFEPGDDGSFLNVTNDWFLTSAEIDPVTYEVNPFLGIIDASIDIKAKNLNSKSHRLLPIVIFGAEDFDVQDINLLSLELAGAAPTAKGKRPVGLLDDVNEDSIDDLLLYFAVQDLDLADFPTELILNGLFNDGIAFTGSDTIRLVGAGANGDGVVPAAVEVIPEPATMSLLGLGGLALLKRRRK